MWSRLWSVVGGRRLPSFGQSGAPRGRRTNLRELARRLLHFIAVWPFLLGVHEAGHLVTARQQGKVVRRVTVGVGPVLWQGRHDGTDLVLRLVPVVGMTSMAQSPPGEERQSGAWTAWRREGATVAGGVLATLVLGVGMACLVALWERGTRRRWVWGRFVVADAVVLTVFNFLPVPPLDGGRALLGAIAAWQGAPLSGDALFWVQVGGLVLAVVPMAFWTRWTARIDRAVLRWGAPGVVAR